MLQSKNKQYSIIKFGGAALSDLEGFRKITSILKNESKSKQLVIISAFFKSTSILEKAAKIAETDCEKAALQILKVFLDFHLNIIREIITQKDNIKYLDKYLNEQSESATNYIRGVSITRELTPKTLDTILSFGEKFALEILKYYFNEQGLKSAFIDAGEIIVTDNNFGKAEPLMNQTGSNISAKIIPLFDRFDIIVTQGYIAKTANGINTTMGKESSNLTAVIFADYLKVAEIKFLTDVAGINTADPKIVQDTRTIPKLNYKTAYRLAVNGLKLIYPPMLEFAEKRGIRLVYCSAFDPDKGSTDISSENESSETPVIIARNELTKICVLHSSASIILKEVVSSKKIMPMIVRVVYSEASINIFCRNNTRYLTGLLADKEYSAKHNYSEISICGVSNIISRKIFRFISDNSNSFEFSAENEIVRLYVPDSEAGEIINKLHEIIINGHLQ